MSDRCGVVVIKDDLKFAGQRVKIVSQGKLQIDCEFEGDVTGTPATLPLTLACSLMTTSHA